MDPKFKVGDKVRLRDLYKKNYRKSIQNEVGEVVGATRWWTSIFYQVKFPSVQMPYNLRSRTIESANIA